MRAVLPVLLAGLLLAGTPRALAQPTDIPSAAPRPEDVAGALSLLRAGRPGRYMVAGAECRPEPAAAWPGYDSLPDGVLRRCRYIATSCTPLRGAARATCEARRTIPGPKPASVVLLEVGEERMARWIASACAEAGGDRARCLRRVHAEGHGQSNWQIPIAGIVFEAMGPDYVEYGYAFRDGMTVVADAACGWRNGRRGEAPPTPAQDAACSRPDAVPRGVSLKARPMSTTRADLLAWRPELAAELPPHPPGFPVTGAAAEAWRAWVRATLVAAAGADANPLVTARALALRRAGAF